MYQKFNYKFKKEKNTNDTKKTNTKLKKANTKKVKSTKNEQRQFISFIELKKC